MSMSRETLPAELYRSNEAYEREIDTVFRRSWACAGRSEYVDAPGSYRATEVAGQNIVIVRDHDGTLRAFHNVCRHRGALLCDAAPAHSSARSSAPTIRGSTASTAN